MSMTIDDVCDGILGKAADARRFLVAVAGPPGAGKSTLADALAHRLVARGETAEVLPMDGFHMDNDVLVQRSLLARKGAPQTFDLRGFIDILKAVKAAEEEVLVPVFDRDRELAIAAARVVSPCHRFIVIEGNYLLLQQYRWAELRSLFDYAVMLSPPLEDLERRLIARWRHYGLSDEALTAKVYENDMPNVRLVLSQSAGADLVMKDWALDS
jgi:pantothenate kinase